MNDQVDKDYDPDIFEADPELFKDRRKKAILFGILGAGILVSSVVLTFVWNVSIFSTGTEDRIKGIVLTIGIVVGFAQVGYARQNVAKIRMEMASSWRLVKDKHLLFAYENGGRLYGNLYLYLIVKVIVIKPNPDSTGGSLGLTLRNGEQITLDNVANVDDLHEVLDEYAEGNSTDCLAHMGIR